MIKTDLHTHSVYSDGLYNPFELCKRAKNNGVKILSITDHDTMSGDEEKRKAAIENDLIFVRGWEVSAYSGEHKVHITGYCCEMNEKYEKFMNDRIKYGYERAEYAIKKFRQLGIYMDMEKIKKFRAHEDSPIHTMHIARTVESITGMPAGKVYVTYLAPGKIAHSTIGRPTPYEAVDCIHSLGGIACIAHPGRIDMDIEERNKLIFSLADYGVDGIEAVYTTHTDKETKEFIKIAEKANLLVSGGSDTHVECDGIHMIGRPEFYPSSKLLEALKIDLR